MNPEQLFRWIFVAVFLGTFFISGYFRRRARQASGTIERVREGRMALLARAFFAALLYLSFLAYMLNPGWMDWSRLALPVWLRWLGAAGGFATLPLITWVMTSIGRNVSETYLTKEHHELVTHGPYRYIRHPLYTVATFGFVSLGLLATNWFMLSIALVAFVAIALFVVPREEEQLVRKFGEAYRQYQRHTGRFIPRLPGVEQP